MLKPKRANIFALILIFFTILTSAAVGVIFLNIDSVYAEQAETAVMVLQDVFMLLLPVAVYCIVFRTKITDIIPHEMLSLKNVGYIVFLTLLITPAIMLVSSIAALFYTTDINSRIISEMDKMPLLLALFAIAVMPAVFEELAFRGIILSNLKSQPLLKAAVISGLFFGLFHLDFYQMGYAVVAGFFFSILVAQTNSIFASMLSHFIINGTQVLNVKLILSVMTSVQKEQLISAVPSTEDNLMTVLVSFMLFIVTFPILLLVTRNFMRYNREHYIDYMYSLGNGRVNEFEVSLEKENAGKRVVDVYFVLYVVIALILSAGLAFINHLQ